MAVELTPGCWCQLGAKLTPGWRNNRYETYGFYRDSVTRYGRFVSFGLGLSTTVNQWVPLPPDVSKTSPRLGRTPEDSGGLERTQMRAEALAANHLVTKVARHQLVRKTAGPFPPFGTKWNIVFCFQHDRKHDREKTN